MIKNAQLKGVDVAPASYHKQAAKRGEPGYTMSPSAMLRFARGPEAWILAGQQIAAYTAELATTEDRQVIGYLRRRLSELEEESQSKDFGNLFDTLLLTPRAFNERYVLRPATYLEEVLECPNCGSVTESPNCRKCKRERVPTVIEKKWQSNSSYCQEWIADMEAAGKSIVSPMALREVEEAIRLFRAKPDCEKLLDVSERQVHVIGEWHDRPTGLVIPIQCLIDLVPAKGAEYIPSVEMTWPQCLADIKTSVVVDRRRYSQKTEAFGWHVQAAFDLDLYNAATGEERDTWIHAGVRNHGEHQPFRKIFDSRYITAGKSAYFRILSNYCQCLKYNRWPDADASPASLAGFDLISPDDRLAEREAIAEFYDFDDAPESPELAEETIGDDVTP